MLLAISHLLPMYSRGVRIHIILVLYVERRAIGTDRIRTADTQ
jgi:hypothetical protein